MRYLIIIVSALVIGACTVSPTTDGLSSQITDCEGNAIDGITDRELVLCVAKAPTYPRSAQLKGIEGVCITTFDVGVDGRISNAEARCSPEGVFEEAAIAVKKDFRYLPRVENGVPVETTGVTRKDYFQL